MKLMTPLIAMTAACATPGSHPDAHSCLSRIRATNTLEQILSVLVENYHVSAVKAKAIAEELMTGEESPEEVCKTL